MSSARGYFLGGYGWRSLSVGFWYLLGGIGTGYSYDSLLRQNGQIDWVLVAIWSWMALLLPWRVSWVRDALLCAICLVGGGVIEWWGTTTEIWWYYTAERPPLWIIPAWATAGVTIDKTLLLLRHYHERLWGPKRLSKRVWYGVYWVLLLGFFGWMFHFYYPSLSKTSSQVVTVIIAVTIFSVQDPYEDSFLFVAGSLLGILIEYWGTSRECWTYYTLQIPPPVTILAHGFAALSFRRVLWACQWLAKRLKFHKLAEGMEPSKA